MELLATLSIVALLTVSVAGLRQGDRDKQSDKIFQPLADLVQAGDFPFFVSIQIRGNHTCGGFIYNEEWVVTVASCVQNFTAEEVKVVVGELSLIALDPGQHTYAVFSIIVYDLYNNSTKLHDVALLQMAEPIKPHELRPGVPVSCILYDEMRANLKFGDIVGFGQNYEDATAPAIRLRSGKIGELEADCTIDYPAAGEYNPNYMICVGGINYSSPCRFDEGSPLVQFINGQNYNVTVGIFSKNKGCESGEPSIFTRLASYYSWFQAIAGYQSSSPSTCELPA